MMVLEYFFVCEIICVLLKKGENYYLVIVITTFIFNHESVVIPIYIHLVVLYKIRHLIPKINLAFDTFFS